MTKYLIHVQKSEDEKMPIYYPVFYNTLEESVEEAKALLESHPIKGVKAYIEKADEEDIFITGLHLKIKNKKTVEIVA